MTFAEKCRSYTTAKRLTQEEVAAAVGISKRTYIYYETGEKLPRRLETAEKLARLFGVELNELVVLDDERFLELRKKRPVGERADELINELRALLMDETKDRDKRSQTVARLKELCAEFERAFNEKLNETETHNESED